MSAIIRSLAIASIIAAVAAPGLPAQAQEWPTRPVRLLVGAGPGGGTDLISRIMADALPKSLGQPVVIENRPGAGTTLASEAVAKAAPDGYTALMMSNGHAVAATIYKSLRYDSVADFQGASLTAAIPLVLVTGPNSWKTSAKSTWCSTSSAETSGNGPQA